MIILYICVGFFLILSNISISGFTGFHIKLFGIILIIYALYRGYLFWRKYFKEEKEEGEQ